MRAQCSYVNHFAALRVWEHEGNFTKETVIINNGANEIILIQHRKFRKRLGAREVITTLYSSSAHGRNQIINLHSKPKVGQLPIFMYRDHDGNLMREVRCVLQKYESLFQCFLHEKELICNDEKKKLNQRQKDTIILVLKGLLQIADTAMN